MTTNDRSFAGSIAPSGEVNADVRTSMTGQFLMAAAIQTRAARAIEGKLVADVLEDDQVAHRGFVVGAVMQATAALECEIWEVMIYGPGHHLGSDGIDVEARDFLSPTAEVIDGKSVLERYQIVLHLLKKNRLDRGAQTWQDAALVVRLRNELVHYKSRSGQELERTNLIRALRQKGHPKPPFIQQSANFFPRECLSASCARWAVASCVAFLDGFYANLGFGGRLDPYRARVTE